MERGTISSSDVYVKNFTLLPPVGLWQNPTANVTRTDNAYLLWTAFDQTPDYYMKLPSEKKADAALTREGEFFLLSSKAMENLHDIEVDMTALNPYTDAKTISTWAKGATAYTIQTGIFMPADLELLSAIAVSAIVVCSPVDKGAVRLDVNQMALSKWLIQLRGTSPCVLLFQYSWVAPMLSKSMRYQVSKLEPPSSSTSRTVSRPLKSSVSWWCSWTSVVSAGR